MTNSRITITAQLCALCFWSLHVIGCASMSGTTDKWASAWKRSTEPKPADPNHEVVNTYWGQKKKEPEIKPMPPELKERLTKKNNDPQKDRTYADSLNLGNQKLKEGRLDEARRAYEQALAARPDDPDVHHRLAVIADKQQMFGVADDHYEAAQRKRPRDPNLLSDIGYSHVLRGDDKGAERILREALVIDPSHKGAMLNLASLFGKQGRYDDAYAALKQGTTEAETQQYLAQLFPQGRPSNVALASNQTDSARRAPAMPADDKMDVRNMTVEQLKAEMDRRAAEAAQKRQAPATQGDWMSGPLAQESRSAQDPTTGAGSNNPLAAQNPASGQPAAQNANGANSTFPTITPFNQNSPQPPAQVASVNGSNSNNAFVAPGTSNQDISGSLVAPPGTNPHSNLDFWKGASAQPNGMAQPANPGANMPSAQSMIEQMSHTQNGVARNASASQAAAQLGMSAGPGSLFPIVPANDVTMPASGASGSRTLMNAYDQRYSGEFSPAQPDAFSNGQNGPHRSLSQGQPIVLGPERPSYNQFEGNPQRDASPRQFNPAPVFSNGGGPMNSAPSPARNGSVSPWDDTSVRPQNPPNNGSGTFPPSGIIQAGATMEGSTNNFNPASNQNAVPNEKETNGYSRYARTPWPDPNNELIGSRPFNGSWPANNASPNGSTFGGSTSQNSLPMWNGGTNSQPATSNGSGFVTSSPAPSTSNSPPQWPYSPQR